MNQIKAVGIVGNTGHLGQIVTDTFIQCNKFDKIYLINASASEKESTEKQHLQKKWIQQGAIVISMTEPRFLEHLKHIDCIISCLNGDALTAVQLSLIDMAEKAGVKLFIPSEFGLDFEFNPYGHMNSVFQAKMKVREVLRQKKLKHLIVLAGLFTDFYLSPPFGIDLKNQEITLYAADSTYPLPFIHRQDIGRALCLYLASKEITANFPPKITLISEEISLNAFEELLLEQFPKLRVQKLSLTETEALVAKDNWNLNTFGPQIALLTAKGVWKQPSEIIKTDSICPGAITMSKFLENSL
jgi:NmrA-like family